LLKFRLRRAGARGESRERRERERRAR